MNEMARVVRPGGEIRLGRVLIGKEYEPQRILSQGIEETLKHLEEMGFEVEKIKTPSDDTYEYDSDHKPIKLLAEAYLVTIRKRESRG